MRVHTAMSVPEKEMMYANINDVFHSASSPDLSWQPCARLLAFLCACPSSPCHGPKGCRKRKWSMRGLAISLPELGGPVNDGEGCGTKGNVVKAD